MTATAKVQQIRTFDFSRRDLFNEVYIPLLKDRSEFLHLYGSAGSGKSRFAAQKEVLLSFKPERRGRRTLVVRKVAKTLKDSVYAELKSVVYEWKLADCFEMLKSPLELHNRLTGVQFIFIGLDDVEKVKSISGVDRIWIEEATELTSPTELDQLRLRLRGYDQVQITLSYNPINEHHWLNTDIHERRPEGHRLSKSTYRDNAKLLAKDPQYAETVERLKETNPNYYRVYALGEWGKNAEGLIYPEYGVADEVPEAQFYGLDFGYNDPCALVEGSVRDSFTSGRKDYFVRELVYETHLTSSDLAARMDRLKVSRRLPIVADSARPEMIEDLRKAGYNVKPCTKYKGSVVDGINEVKKHGLKVAAGSRNLFREITNYSWREANGRFLDDEPVDAVNHLMDAMRYALEAARVEPWKFSEFRF